MARRFALLMVVFLVGNETIQPQEKPFPQSPVLAPLLTGPMDSQGDPLPMGALSRLGSARLRHGHKVMAVAFSPDGRALASAGWDHTVRLWDVSTGKELRRLAIESERDNPYVPSRWAYCLAFSPDGKHLVCGHHGEEAWRVTGLHLWEVATGKLLHKLEGHQRGILAVAFSPAGGMVASAGLDGLMGLWIPATGQRRGFAFAHKGLPVRSVTFAPGGKVLASAGDDQTIRLWDPAAGKEIRQWTANHKGIEALCFSKDGQQLASAGRDHTVRLWDANSGKELAVFAGHRDEVLRVCVAPDGKSLASTGKDRTIRLWDLAAKKMTRMWEGHHKEVRGLAFSPDGKTLASGAADQRICLWDVATGKELLPQPGHHDWVNTIGFLRDGKRLVSLGHDGTIRWWDLNKSQEIRQMPWEVLPLRAAAFAPGIDLLALGSPTGGIRLLDTATGKERAPCKDDGGPLLSVAFSPDAQTLATVDQKGVRTWGVASSTMRKRPARQPASVQLALMAPDNKRLFLGGDSQSYLWDLEADKSLQQLPLPFRRLKSAAFSPDGRLLACGDWDGKVHVWDSLRGAEIRVHTGLAGFIHCLAISPDGRFLCAGGWRCIKMWEIETGVERRQLRGYEGDAFSLSFSPDGRKLASGNGDLNLIIWDIPGETLADNTGAPKAKEKVQTLWDNLASTDGSLIHQAVWGLVAQPAQAVPLLRSKIKPVPPLHDKHFQQLLKDLDDDLFSVREKASKELQKLGDLAEPALQQILLNPPSLEVQRRVATLLERLAKTLAGPEFSQALRGVEVLEHTSTPEAQQLLQELSQGAPTARISREARAALNRRKTLKP